MTYRLHATRSSSPEHREMVRNAAKARRREWRRRFPTRRLLRRYVYSSLEVRFNGVRFDGVESLNYEAQPLRAVTNFPADGWVDITWALDPDEYEPEDDEPEGEIRRQAPIRPPHIDRPERRPPPPESLIGALQDRPHADSGRLIRAVPLRRPT